MTIELLQLAIHELIKQPDNSEAALHLSDRLVPVDERAERLVGKMHKILVSKSDVLNGRLAAPEDALFPGHFALLAESDFSEEGFLQFSRESMQALQLSLQGVVGAKGGYLVFALYRPGPGEFNLGIFLVRDADGVVFRTTDDGNYQLNTTTYLDVDRLALAGRIDIPTDREAWQPRVEVIKHVRTQKQISDYFLSWLAIEESVSNKDMTHHFLEAVAAAPVPQDKETGESIPEGEFREQVASFALKSPGKVVNIPAFEQQFYGQETPIQDYLQEQNVGHTEQFRPDASTLRDYHFHKFKGQGYYFGCKHAFLLSGEVRVEGSQIIIDNEELAEQIMDILQGMG